MVSGYHHGHEIYEIKENKLNWFGYKKKYKPQHTRDTCKITNTANITPMSRPYHGINGIMGKRENMA